MKRIFNIAAVSATLLLSSCATIFTGTTQTVQINSNPPAATIEVDGVKTGVTPMAVTLKKGFTGQTISLKLDGYETKTFHPQTTFNAVSVVNFLFIPGFIVDAATGAMMKYDPKVYEFTLEQKKAN
ncbi:PEGA domain-containing protein [Pedobacter psychrodurus]|uniref:PEGA domain-containing protein n=1 Tax=Pedobacter psychrodurus TaxID=2530456 RepID=A0A4R0PNU3_9SPHI|nr:PEGA domain-containing protein [Pedobacter psychrodurus]TCD19863.1 PEGA domain-containing protein [Pedobacter psychrodurus]